LLLARSRSGLTRLSPGLQRGRRSSGLQLMAGRQTPVPEHIPGNILDLNTQDIEVDTSGWESDSANLVRQKAVMVNPGEDWIMVGVATGAAPIVIRTAQAFPLEVTGTRYAVYGHVF